MSGAALRITSGPDPDSAGVASGPHPGPGQRNHRTQWRNALPAWVSDHELVSPLPPGSRGSARSPGGDGRKRAGENQARRTRRLIVQSIADLADRPDAAGNLVGAFGGGRLLERTGLSRRTLWRRLKELIEGGLVVLLTRGGHVPAVDGWRGWNAANVYGVPGHPGALHHRAAERRRVIMRPTDMVDAQGRPKHVPQVIEPGAVPGLWATNRPRGPGSVTQSARHYPRASVTLPPCQRDTLPSPTPSPVQDEVHGGFAPSSDGPQKPCKTRNTRKPSGRRGRPRKAGARGRDAAHVDPAVLEGGPALRAYIDAVVVSGRYGWRACEAHRQQIAALTAYAKRVGNTSRAGLLATHVRFGPDGEGRMYLRNEDDDEGRRLLKARQTQEVQVEALEVEVTPETPPEVPLEVAPACTPPEAPRDETPSAPREVATTATTDADLVAQARSVLKVKPKGTTLLEVLRGFRPEWGGGESWDEARLAAAIGVAPDGSSRILTGDGSPSGPDEGVRVSA